MSANRPTEGSEADYRRSELLSCLARSPGQAPTLLGRLVTLVSLSHRIPETFLADQLAQSVRAETGQSVLLVRILLSDAGVPLQSWSLHQTSWSEQFAFAEHIQQTAGGAEKLSVRVSDEPLERNFLAAFIGHCKRHYPLVLLHLDSEIPARLLVEGIVRSELAWALIDSDTDSASRFIQLSRNVREESPASSPTLTPVLCVDEDSMQTGSEAAHALGVQAQVRLRGVKAASSGGMSEVFGTDLRRLAREAGRCRVGLALSAGAAKGLAHVGVLQVLEENGIEVDMVAGTSMGAYVGALWASGHPASFLEEKARELERPGNMWSLIDPVLPPRQGFMRGLGVKHRLMRSIGSAHFEELPRAFRVVTTNLETLERTVFSTGEVATAVHASCAIPGACVPVEIGGELYIDGGVSDPVPVDVLREAGIEKVIAVNVIPTPAVLRCSRERQRELSDVTARSRSPLHYLNQQMNYFADGNILDVIQRSILGAQIRNAEEACRSADVVLRPVACDGFWHDFKNASRYVALGRRVATEQLDAIKTLTKRPVTNKAYEPHILSHAVAAAA